MFIGGGGIGVKVSFNMNDKELKELNKAYEDYFTTKNSASAYNKKIKKALEVIDVWFDDRFQLDILDWKLMKDDLAKIKKILEE